MHTKCAFTLEHYFDVLDVAKKEGYAVGPLCEFERLKKNPKFIILRHDVDLSLRYAVRLAGLEAERGIRAIYFILLHNDLYNVMSKEGSEIISQISGMGHEIGLHIDTRFFKLGEPAVKQVEEECRILGKITGNKITSISQHFLKITPDMPELASRYLDARDQKVLDVVTYISDSGRNWRQGCMCNHVGKVERLQILTHPIWWVADAGSRDLTLDRFKNDMAAEAARHAENFRQVVHEYVRDQLHQKA